MKVGFVLLLLAACGSVSGDDKKDAAVSVDSRSIDAAIDAPPVPFSPSMLPGLVMWLDADKGVVSSQGNVSGWADQSTSQNSATQSTAARQPAVVANVLNGHAVIRFDGTNHALVVPDSTSLQWGTDDFTIAAVASWTNLMANYGLIVSKQREDTYPYVGSSIWANFPQPSASTKFGFQLDAQTNYFQANTSGLNDGVPRVVVGRRTGTTMEARVNGASDGTFTTATVIDSNAVGYSLFIGGHPQTNGIIQGLKGDIAEIILVHGTLSDTDMQKLETYLKTKYGI